MDLQSLIDFGMTKTEARIYIGLVKLGQTQIGLIIKHTSLHRGTVYNSVNSLMKKGFVSFIDKNGIRYYTNSGEKIFENLIEERKSKLEENKKQIDNLFEDLSKIKQDENQEVQVFYGTESFKTLFLEIYNECKKNKIEYFFQGRGGEMQDAIGEGFYKYTQQLKKKMKIKCRVILDTENIHHSYHKYVTGNLRYLSTKVFSPVNYWIYGDTILLVIFQANPLTTIRIKSKYLADSFKNYFEQLWGLSRGFEEKKIGAKELINLISNTKRLNAFYGKNRIPFFLCSFKEKEFISFMMAREKKGETLHGQSSVEVFRCIISSLKKGLNVRYIVTKNSLDYFFKIINEDFGKRELKKIVNEILINMKKYKISTRVINENTPITFFSSEKEIITFLPTSEKVGGFTSAEYSIKETFSRLFQEYWNRSKPIEDYLKKLNDF